MFTLATAALAATAGTQHGRSLSYTQILGYSPGSQVTDHANIDLDQAAMESELKSYDFTGAKAIYTNGAHSKPTATCTLVSPTTLGAAVAKKASVTFTTNNGDPTTGKAYSSYTSTSTTVLFTYMVSAGRVQEATTACYVGGLPPASQNTQGCIEVGTGSGGLSAGQSTFTIGGMTYTATCTNNGKRTLQGFSTKAKAVMYDCPVDTAVSYANAARTPRTPRTTTTTATSRTPTPSSRPPSTRRRSRPSPTATPTSPPRRMCRASSTPRRAPRT
jgi:hypothetical protein